MLSLVVQSVCVLITSPSFIAGKLPFVFGDGGKYDGWSIAFHGSWATTASRRVGWIASEVCPATCRTVGGLFPYDGCDSPRITPANRMLAQFTWAAVGAPIYLYQTSAKKLYLYHYR